MCARIGNVRATWRMIARGARGMSNLWCVTLFHRDSKTYPRIIVSARTEDEAKQAACAIELAPLRSVVSVGEYRETH